MRKRLFFVACAVLLGIGLGFSKWNTEQDVSTQAKSEATPEHLNRVREQESINKAELNHKIAKLHIPFIINQGQSDESVKFYANTFGGTVFITREGEIIYSLPKVEDMEQMKRLAKEIVSSDLKPETRNLKSIKRLALKEEVVGGKVKEVKGEGEAVTKVSYFKRNNPSKWKRDIPTHDLVSLGEVYEGVELKLKAYGNNVEKLFYIKPGEEPEKIRMKLSEGKLNINENGELEVETKFGTVKFTKPVAYHENGRERKFVEAAYIVSGNEYGFKIGEYDRTKELIIDPILSATFLGGSGTDFAEAIAVDNGGNVYIAGFIDSSSDSTFTFTEAFIAKLNSSLSQILAATFLGGNGNDNALDIALDSTGNVYITGHTTSSDFPGVDSGSADSTFGEELSFEAFVAKLNSNLSSILSATFLGGGDNESSNDIILDDTGNVYITGFTRSSDFPGVSVESPDNTVAGFGEAYVAKLNSDLSSVISATFLGGNGFNEGRAIAIDSTGNIYAVGIAGSSDFPGISSSSADSTFADGEAYIVKLNSDLSSIIIATFLGGDTGSDSASAVAIGGAGNIYVAGTTSSSDFPGVDSGSADNFINEDIDEGDFVQEAFIAKLNSNLDSILAATFLGGSDIEFFPIALVLGNSGNVYVTGETDSSDFPGRGPGSADNKFADSEVFVAKLNSGLNSIFSATFLGGSSLDASTDITLGGLGNVYVAGSTFSSDFPGIGPGSADGVFSNITERQAFVAKLDPNLSAPFCHGFRATISGTQGNNVLSGTSGRDVIHGLGGNDIINSFGGNDIICGGGGNDTMNGGNDNDRMFGGDGNDTLYGSNGDDRIDGNNGIDSCYGGAHINGDTAVRCDRVINVP